MRRLALTSSCALLLAGGQLYWTKPGATLAKRVRLDSIPEHIPWEKRN
jgi:hypothetical protein